MAIFIYTVVHFRPLHVHRGPAPYMYLRLAHFTLGKRAELHAVERQKAKYSVTCPDIATYPRMFFSLTGPDFMLNLSVVTPREAKATVRP